METATQQLNKWRHSSVNINRLRAMSKFSQPKAVQKAAELKTKQLAQDAKRLSLDLAYVLGVAKGDGCTSTAQRRIILSATDKDFVATFKTALENWSKFNARFYSRDIKKPDYIKTRKTQWVSYIDSKEAADFLASFNINGILSASNDVKCAFLKGLFDSEGSVSKDSVIFYNSNKSLTQLVYNLLQQLNIEPQINNYKAKSLSGKEILYSRVCIYKKDSLRKFANLIGFSIKRKSNKLHTLVNPKGGDDKNDR
jgi:intein-encoded DNA endonuclease-like protein